MDTSRPPAHGHGDVRAEPDRISWKAVIGFGVAVIVLCVVAFVLVVVLFRGLENRADKKDEKSLAAAGTERMPDAPPPVPRLQVYPVAHWRDFQAAERQRLTSYGWMDRSRGAVHIPIERAMELVAARGVGPLPQAPMAMPGVEPTPVEKKP